MYQYFPGLPNYNASATAGEHLTIGLDFYTVTTGVNILQSPVGPFTDVPNLTPVAANAAAYANSTEFVAGTIPNDFSQDALDRLVEIISERGQPVIMGTPTATTANSANVYAFTFAIEHLSAWGVVSNATAQPVPLLANAIQMGGIDFGFNTDSSLAVTVKNTI